MSMSTASVMCQWVQPVSCVNEYSHCYVSCVDTVVLSLSSDVRLDMLREMQQTPPPPPTSNTSITGTHHPQTNKPTYHLKKPKGRNFSEQKMYNDFIQNSFTAVISRLYTLCCELHDICRTPEDVFNDTYAADTGYWPRLI